MFGITLQVWGAEEDTGPEMDEVTGDWKILQEEEARGRYCSPNLIRVMKSGRSRWAGLVKRMEKRGGEYGLWVGRPEGKRPLGITKRRWENDVKVDLKAVV